MLIVDDSAVFRRIIQDALEKIPGVEVIGTAATGLKALNKARELVPDLMTLDMELPDLSGIQVLNELRRMEASPPGILVVSALTTRGGALAMTALENGAFDFITKPEGGSFAQNCMALFTSLEPLIRGFQRRLGIHAILKGKLPELPSGVSRGVAIPTPSLDHVAERMRKLEGRTKPQMVLIGVSTGGPNALGELLPTLPGDIGVPVFIVLHIPPMFTKPLVERLQPKCAIQVREAENGEWAQPNVAYIGQGGRHLRLAKNSGGQILLQLVDDPPENNCKPSVDVLFRSAAHHFPGRAMAVILTGMGNDGTTGLRLLKRHECHAIAQDESTSIVFGMPKAVIEAGVVDQILPLNAIGAAMVSVIRNGFPGRKESDIDRH